MLCSGALLFGMMGVTACAGDGFQVAEARFNVSSLELAVGDDATLSVQVSKFATSAPLYWVSTNENVAMVRDGHVLATGIGECEIHAYIGGGRAICKVTVSENGGGGGEQTPFLRVSPSSRTIKVGGVFKVTANAYPKDTTFTFESESPEVASVGGDGTVTGKAVGTAKIKVSGSNEKVGYCNVTVSDTAAGPTNEDIGGTETENFTELKASGSFVIGSPTLHKDLTIKLLQDFNKYTNSNITWEIKDFEESQAAGNLTPDASLGPDVFPYASDQTQGLNTLKALTQLGKTDQNWIKKQMGDEALGAAKLGSIGYVGYPFAADNGYVMIYDKTKVSDPSEIDTLNKLWAKAASYTNPQGRKYRVSYDVANGFYGAGALMSYTGGTNLYQYIALASGYKSKGNFDTEEGIRGAQAVADIFANNQGTLDSQYMIPSDGQRTLAVITDCSKINDLQDKMGDSYAVAPLPYIDDAKQTRLGSFLGYKFYGVNSKKLASDTAKKEVAEKIARFFVSKYAQEKRLEEFHIAPTNLDLQPEAEAKEAHIKALATQKADHSTIGLTVVDQTFWNQVGVAVLDIKEKAEAGTATTAALTSIMQDLSDTLTHNWDD